jgi:phage FluMu gp28-like protein
VNAAIELAKQELWLRGNLDWKLHKAQEILNQVFREARGQLFVGNCSRQWGKSYWGVVKACEVALSTPKAQIRYGAAFQSDLVDFIIPAFEKVIEDAPDECKPKRVGHFYIFPNGSRIKLVGLDKNPNGLRGNTLDLIIIDECGFVTNLDYIYKSVIIPATLHRPNCKIIFIRLSTMSKKLKQKTRT